MTFRRKTTSKGQFKWLILRLSGTQPVKYHPKVFSVLYTPDRNMEIKIKEILLGYISVLLSYSINNWSNFNEKY